MRSSVGRKHRVFERIAKDMVKPLGGTAELAVGGKHMMVHLYVSGQHRKIAVSSTPRSKDNAEDWFRQDVRQALRSIGHTVQGK